MCDLPSVSEVIVRVARKEHVCCECHRTIPRGNKYELFRGCWNGEWDRFKTCIPCSVLREEIASFYNAGEGIPFEGLEEWAKEGGWDWPPGAEGGGDGTN